MAPSAVTATTDCELVRQMAAGDERALGALYDRHVRVVFSLACAIVRERADADEAVGPVSAIDRCGPAEAPLGGTGIVQVGG